MIAGRACAITAGTDSTQIVAARALTFRTLVVVTIVLKVSVTIVQVI